MPSYGSRPQDVVQDVKGSALAGVVVKLYTTEALAKAGGVPDIDTVKTDSRGRWEVNVASGQVWARVPDGTVWSVAGETGFATPADVAAGYYSKPEVDTTVNALSVQINGKAETALTLQKAELSVTTPAMFGAVGDGVADDTIPIRNFLAALNTNGGQGQMPLTYKVTGAITISGLSGKPFTVDGMGTGTIVARPTAAASLMNLNNCTGVVLRRLTLDCGRDQTGNSNHGISAANCVQCRFDQLTVTNWLNTGLMFYYSSGLTGSTSRCEIVDCTLDGGGAANNGVMLESVTDGAIINPRVFNLGRTGSPGYAIQLKNDTRRCRIVGGYAEGAMAGVAFGQTTGTGPSDNTVTGTYIYNCRQGFVAGYSNRNVIDVRIDMNSAADSFRAVQLENGCTGNSITAEVDNVSATQSAIYLNGSDNRIHLRRVRNKGARISQLMAGGNNTITVGKIEGLAFGANPWAGNTDSSGVTTNTFRYEGDADRTATILTSPNGTRYKVTVSDAGSLTVTTA